MHSYRQKPKETWRRTWIN